MLFFFDDFKRFILIIAESIHNALLFSKIIDQREKLKNKDYKEAVARIKLTAGISDGSFLITINKTEAQTRTEKFLKIREENELKQKDAVHDKYLKEYLDLRQSWVSSDNNVCNLFLDKYSDYELDEDDWSSLIWLCEDLFQYSQLPEKMKMLKDL